MNGSEVSALLAMIGATYDRAVPPAKTRMWLELLGDVPAELGRAALIEVMREQEWPPSAAMVRNRAKEITARQRELDQRNARAIVAGARHAQDDTEERPPGGAQIVSHVLRGLAAARATNGGQLGPERAAEVAGDLVEDWREEHPGSTISARTGEPCGNPKCQCTHTGGCDAGWMPHDGKTWMPCRICNVRRHTICTAGDRRATAQSKLRDTADLPKKGPTP